MKSVEEIKNELRVWVSENGKISGLPAIKDETPIIENRIISSVQVMDLILFMEYLLGRPVKPEHIRPGSFASINAIYDSFFRPEEINV